VASLGRPEILVDGVRPPVLCPPGSAEAVRHLLRVHRLKRCPREFGLTTELEQVSGDSPDGVINVRLDIEAALEAEGSR